MSAQPQSAAFGKEPSDDLRHYAYLAGEANRIVFSVHGSVAAHYGVNAQDIGESHATSLDYLVVAVGG